VLTKRAGFFSGRDGYQFGAWFIILGDNNFFTLINPFQQFVEVFFGILQGNIFATHNDTPQVRYDLHDTTKSGFRQRLVVNPGLKDRRYNTLETWANVEAGKLTRLELNVIPILNSNEPFRHIAGGQSQALLVGDDQQLT